jgi:hypothetical protein
MSFGRMWSIIREKDSYNRCIWHLSDYFEFYLHIFFYMHYLHFMYIRTPCNCNLSLIMVHIESKHVIIRHDAVNKLLYEYLVGSFNNLQNFRLMNAVKMELTHPVKVQTVPEHKPYFSELNDKWREIISIVYYLHQIRLFQYKCGFSVSPHLRLLVLDSESRSQVSIEATSRWIVVEKTTLSVFFHHCFTPTFIHLLPTIWS